VIERSWEVRPGAGVGPLRFGTPRAELRAAFGPHEAFRRGATSDLTDAYDADGFMLTCTGDGGLHLIEIPDPVGVHYRGVHLGGGAGTVLAELRGAGIQATADDSGWSLADGAIALFTTSSDPEAPIEAVTVFGPGREIRGETVFFPPGEAATPPARTHVVSPGRGVDSVMLGQSRDDVRSRLSGGLFWSPPATEQPVEDTFIEDGLVVRYRADLRVDRIFVTKADAVLLDAINLMPPYPQTVDVVSSALVRAGHQVIEREAAIEVAGTGVQVLTSRPSSSGSGPMPVSCVVVSAAAESGALGDESQPQHRRGVVGPGGLDPHVGADARE
jgi:hypothetical protein